MENFPHVRAFRVCILSGNFFVRSPFACELWQQHSRRKWGPAVWATTLHVGFGIKI
jgi:hypothetical protein